MVPNYTGDRLNYGLGMERGIQEGLKLSSVTVGEDCAKTSQDKSAGRRGLVGVITIMKVTSMACSSCMNIQGYYHLSWSLMTILLTCLYAITVIFAVGSC